MRGGGRDPSPGRLPGSGLEEAGDWAAFTEVAAFVSQGEVFGAGRASAGELTLGAGERGNGQGAGAGEGAEAGKGAEAGRPFSVAGPGAVIPTVDCDPAPNARHWAARKRPRA